MPDFDFQQQLRLENERVLLRPLTAEDYDYLSPLAFADKDIIRFSPRQIHTPELLQEYLQDALRGRAAATRYPFLIFDKETQAYAGSTSICAVSNFDKRLEIGYTWYGKKFQRTGLNRHCKWLLLQYAFETLGFERVEFKVDERNVVSQTAVLRLGATKEGTLRSHTVMSDSFRRNTVYFSILKDEWASIKAHFPLY
ncbi:MAG: GNAT family N-acetyltransferase [Chitinophagales bacterium]